MTGFLANLEFFAVTEALPVAKKVLWALALLAVGFWLIKWVMKHFDRLNKGKKIEDGAFAFLKSLLSIALKVVLVFTVAMYLGVPSASIVALLGSAGLAVGLALQGSLSNFAGGVVILVFKPFKIGDYIESGSGEGTVQDISVLYTTLATVDNKTIVIPNGELSNKAVTNYSKMERRRVDLTFSVAYGSDIEQVKNILLAAAADSRIHKDPAPFVGLLTLAESSMDFALRVWCDTADYWDVYFYLIETVKAQLDRQGIEVPFPQLDVHTR